MQSRVLRVVDTRPPAGEIFQDEIGNTYTWFLEPHIEPAVFCTHEDAVMTHVNGTTFVCHCGRGHSTDWPLALEIDSAIATRSATDDEMVDQLTILLSAEGVHTPAGADPDRCSGRDDAPALVGMACKASANDIAAVLLWRADLDSRETEVAA
jgi:hypothetical protein